MPPQGDRDKADDGGPQTQQVPMGEMLGSANVAHRPRHMMRGEDPREVAGPLPRPPAGAATTPSPATGVSAASSPAAGASAASSPTAAANAMPPPPAAAAAAASSPAAGATATPRPSAGAGPPARPKLRYRILPRSLLGITSLILAFSIGAGLSGVVLYSYYQYRLNQTNDRVNNLLNGYRQQFQNAEGDLKAATDAGKAQIQAALGPLQQLEAAPATLAGLVRKLAPSLFYVHTLDSSGQPSVGTAFVVSSSSNQSLLLTSYDTIQAATRQPGPGVFVRQGQGADTPVTVRTWDPQYDLALIVLPRGNLPVIPAAPASPAPTIGQKIFAMSGLGAAGAAITEGTVTDVSASGLAHDAAIGPDYRGGPLVNDSGQVIAVASRSYSPFGFASDGVWYAPFVQAACNKVLSCPNGSIAGSQ